MFAWYKSLTWNLSERSRQVMGKRWTEDKDRQQSGSDDQD